MLNGYPRPQFQRANWLNLNGEWDFLFDDEEKGEEQQWYKAFPGGSKILVPYTYETSMSGIDDQTHHSTIWYRKKIMIEEKTEKHILLNFEGVDYDTRVWVNGIFAGNHQGAYTAFTIDITNALIPGENTIIVCAKDSISREQPRGKQRWKKENFGCWYIQTTGIWKTVWLEEVPEFYIDSVKMTPDIDQGVIDILIRFAGTMPGKDIFLQHAISLEGKSICNNQSQIAENYLHLMVRLTGEEPWSLALWSPDSPKLYDITFSLVSEDVISDQVDSYFGMRKISIEGNRIFLNNLPIYQRLILDQGYWAESHLTPPSEEAIIKDIDLILEAGYNGLRKHQKLEDRRFLYWCDKKGLLVWSEMAAQYSFHDRGIQMFTTEWMDVVEQNYNHPSIITWTPFNESWGIEQVARNTAQQKFTEGFYHLTKAFDQMRPVIVNDGWEHTVSDIITLHDYVEKGGEFLARYEDKDRLLNNEKPFNIHRYAMANGYSYHGQPVMISEYGGIAIKNGGGWGYGEQVKSEEDFIKRFDSITTAIKSLHYICGYCYTQLTDVQQEMNGLYTMKREPKVNIKKISEINKK